MNNATLLQTIEELIKENKNLTLLNKVLITGIKSMHDNSFANLPSLERMAYQQDCQRIVRAAKLFEYNLNGVKKEDIYDKVMSLTKEELFNVDSEI